MSDLESRFRYSPIALFDRKMSMRCGNYIEVCLIDRTFCPVYGVYGGTNEYLPTCMPTWGWRVARTESLTR